MTCLMGTCTNLVYTYLLTGCAKLYFNNEWKTIGICRCSLLKRAAQPHYFNNGFNSHQTASIRFNQPGLAIMKGWCYKLTYGSPFRYSTKQNRSSPLYMLLHVPAPHQRSPTAANVKPFCFNDNMSDPKTLNSRERHQGSVPFSGFVSELVSNVSPWPAFILGPLGKKEADLCRKWQEAGKAALLFTDTIWSHFCLQHLPLSRAPSPQPPLSHCAVSRCRGSGQSIL